jgi:D-arginine dehydrogenase
MRARVVIIGGGLAGASTAYFLSRSGVRGVLVLEREPVCGVHASGRNAALGRQLTEHPAFTARAVRGAGFLRRPPADFGVESLLSSSGSLLLASRPAVLASLRDRALRVGVPHEVVSAGQIVERWPRLAGAPLVGAVLFPTDGVIDIHALLQGFLAGARAGGAQVMTGCGVTGLNPRVRGLVVETERGSIEAECVVIAAGAWAGQVGAHAGTDPGFAPIRRHLHTTEPVADIDRTAPFAWHLDDEFYVRPEGGALLVSACDELEVEPGDPAPAADAVASLAAKLVRAAPGLADLGVARTWSCLRTFTRNQRGPLIGWDSLVPGVFWVAGLGGHGATSSPAVGEEAAQLIRARL